MIHQWVCPICSEVLIRESSEDAENYKWIIESRHSALHLLTLDAITHLATHIQSLATTARKTK